MLYGGDGNDLLKAYHLPFANLAGNGGDDTLLAENITHFASLWGGDGNDTLKAYDVPKVRFGGGDGDGDTCTIGDGVKESSLEECEIEQVPTPQPVPALAPT